MNNLLILIPVALGLGLLGLVAFVWSLKTNQYDDLDGQPKEFWMKMMVPLPILE